MKYAGKFVTTITEEDIGKVIIARTARLTEHLENGEDHDYEVKRSVWLHGSLGRVQAGDVGKQVWEVDGILQVESNEQRDKRILHEHRWENAHFTVRFGEEKPDGRSH